MATEGRSYLVEKHTKNDWFYQWGVKNPRASKVLGYTATALLCLVGLSPIVMSWPTGHFQPYMLPIFSATEHFLNTSVSLTTGQALVYLCLPSIGTVALAALGLKYLDVHKKGTQ